MISDLRKQIEQLISLYEMQKERADELAAKLVVAEGEISEKKQQIADLKGQVDHYKLAAALSGGEDKAASRERIDKLVKEIDKCIRLLEE